MNFRMKYTYTCLILIFLVSCFNETEPTDEDEASIQRIIDNLHEGFLEYEVTGGTLNEAIRVSNGGMDGIYGVRLADLDNLQGDNILFLRCINELNTNLIQKAQLRNEINDFTVCRFAVGESYLSELETLLESTEESRIEIVVRFDAGTLNAFNEDYMDLKNRYSDPFKACLETLIRKFYGILNPSQWQEFTSCSGT
jgi:hypothetical protein